MLVSISECTRVLRYIKVLDTMQWRRSRKMQILLFKSLAREERTTRNACVRRRLFFFSLSLSVTLTHAHVYTISLLRTSSEAGQS